MRLRSCVTLEVVCAGVLGGALAFGGGAAARVVESELGREAAAASRRPAPDLDRDLGRLGNVGRVGLFDGVADEVLLAPLETGAIRRVRFNRGGSTISLRIDFDNGARAAFKPVQTNLRSVPRYEVAAFRFNRLLGLSTVSPATGRRFSASALLDALDERDATFRERMELEMVVEDGLVAGELSWWIPVIVPAEVSGEAIDSSAGVVTWDRYLDAGAPVPAEDLNTVAQISDMVAFDFVIDNPDRWSGRNVWSSSDGRELYFMDNTLSFGGDGDGTSKTRTYLYRVEKFSRSLIRAFRNLREDQVRAELSAASGPFDPLLTDEEISNLLLRRDFLLDYVDRLIAEHGAESILVFP